MSPFDGRLPADLNARRAREHRKKKSDGKNRVWCFDKDGTITGAPEQCTRIATGLKALGDTIVVITGDPRQRADVVKELKDFGFPYDELIQYNDENTDGTDRAQYLKKLDAWGAFDNRVDRAVVFAEVCPHFYLIVGPAGKVSGDTKKAAKEAAKALH